MFGFENERRGITILFIRVTFRIKYHFGSYVRDRTITAAVFVVVVHNIIIRVYTHAHTRRAILQ